MELAASKPHGTAEQAKRDCALTAMIVTQNLPLSFVEGKNFKKLAAMLDPRWSTPSKNRVKDLLDEGFNRIRANLLHELNQAKSVSLTADMWTSHARAGYLGVTASWVDERFNLHDAVIAFSHLSYPHKGDAIAECMREIMKYWDIQEKVFSITTDSGANMKMASSKLGIKHIPCSAHVLNLIVQKGLLPARHLIARVKRLISFFMTPKQGERLEAVQMSHKQKHKGKARADAREV